MMKRSSSGGGESASAARKRQAASAQDPLDEDPLRPSSSTQEHDTSSVPSNGHLLLALVLPYVQHRATWNSVCCASKELYLAGKEKTPPWPNAILNVGTGAVHAVAFSPRNSFLACSIIAQYVIHV
jgi:hypothetical protein